MTCLVWLRNDLRLNDNPALFYACEMQAGAMASYIVCKEFVQDHDTAPVRLDFIRRHLQILAAQLAVLNIPLLVSFVETAAEIPELLLSLAQNYQCDSLYFNAEYPLDELSRDRKVAALLRENVISVKRFHDRVIVPPGQIRNGQGEPYKVFTAFKKTWLQKVMPLNFQPLAFPAKQPLSGPSLAITDIKKTIASVFKGFELRDLADLWPAGEQEAQQRLAEFVKHSIHDYKAQRDVPALTGTSTLSPYLAVGSISPRQCLAAVLHENRGEWDTGSEGVSCWISEIIWRDFYQHVAYDYPQVCKKQAMQKHTEHFPWRHNQDLFTAWCDGRTGVPLIDAAMLQLKATGWMHNRLRMLVAMYLTKNLQIDWRLGETYFMSQLIDGDFAANNGGWQWSASTGTDAAPYFRIFNPVTQSKRFDPNGEFIRCYLPVLAHLPDKLIHQPPPTEGYPAPIIDLSVSRKSTIELFAQLGSRHH